MISRVRDWSWDCIERGGWPTGWDEVSKPGKTIEQSRWCFAFDIWLKVGRDLNSKYD